uniref:Uncharacterized protein n=1 Tax=Arundo donax TaxID=35708 RepID=A0A0A9DY78_ARUDO
MEQPGKTIGRNAAGYNYHRVESFKRQHKFNLGMVI